MGTFFIVVDFHGSKSGLEIVEKDEDGDRNGEKQSEEKEDNDCLEIMVNGGRLLMTSQLHEDLSQLCNVMERLVQ